MSLSVPSVGARVWPPAWRLRRTPPATWPDCCGAPRFVGEPSQREETRELGLVCAHTGTARPSYVLRGLIEKCRLAPQSAGARARPAPHPRRLAACEQGSGRRRAAPARSRLPLAARLVVGRATSATGSPSPPDRCWSRRRPVNPLLVAWPRSSSACRGCCSACTPVRWPTGSTGVASWCFGRPRARGRPGRACVTIVDRHGQHRLVLAAMFLLGTAETFADTTTRHAAADAGATKADLGIGERPAEAGFITANQLAGPPIGALALRRREWCGRSSRRRVRRPGRVLIARIAVPQRRRRAESDTHVRREIADGLPLARGHRAGPHAGDHDLHVQRHVRRRLVGPRPLRARPLDMGEVGFGLLTTAARSAWPGRRPASYGWLERPVSARQHHARRPRCSRCSPTSHWP